MNLINLIAVPNGVFSLEEIIELPFIKEFIQKMKLVDNPEPIKVKVFLTAYQLVDTLSQLDAQGIDIKQIDMEDMKKFILATIEDCYDSFMNTFTNHERKMIHELVMKNPEACQ
jgi:hypothetical protein